MIKSIYVDVVNMLKSFIITDGIGHRPDYSIKRNFRMKNIDYTIIKSLEDLIKIFNIEKAENDDIFNTYFDEQGLISFLKYYDKTYNISCLCEGDLSLYFSTLYGFLIEIYSTEMEERRYYLKKEDGKHKLVSENLILVLKGEHDDEYYAKLFESPFLKADRGCRLFYIDLDNYKELRKRVIERDSTVSLYTYIPDYYRVCEKMYYHAQNIQEDNMYEIINDIKPDIEIKKQRDKETENMKKIAEEFYKRFEIDIKINPYMPYDTSKYYPLEKQLKYTLNNIDKCGIIPVGEFFKMGGSIISR